MYDTNVIVSALLTSEGIPAILLDLATQQEVTLFVSEEILQEYEGVLLRPKFGFSKKLVKRFIRLLKTKSRVLKPKPLGFHLKDPGDNKFLECALAGKVNYLVTGNARHFPSQAYKGIQIISPREFWEMYKESL
ncbi:MAG: putative toxin-antitoxin system toxin component, PIN family [Thermodesulfobacteriota bacterium]